MKLFISEQSQSDVLALHKHHPVIPLIQETDIRYHLISYHERCANAFPEPQPAGSMWAWALTTSPLT